MDTPLPTLTAPVSKEDRIPLVASEIQARLTAGPVELDEKVQETLARLLGLLNYLRKPEFSCLLPEWEIAVRALLASPKNQKFSDDLCDRIRYKVRPSSNPISAIMRGGTPPTRVILGLGTLLYFAIPLLFFVLPKIVTQPMILGIKSEMLVAVGLAGALGSIVRIMVRIHDFGKSSEVDPSVLYMTGFFKPVVGLSFALFVFSVIKAGLIPITITPDSETYFFFALAFVSGFSERFAKDVATATEKKINAAG